MGGAREYGAKEQSRETPGKDFRYILRCVFIIKQFKLKSYVLSLLFNFLNGTFLSINQSEIGSSSFIH